MNFLKNRILFRCDAGKVNELGSGHLYRCITIAKYLKKKFKLQNKKIIFIIKDGGKFASAKKILDHYSFRVVKIKENINNYSLKEFEILSKFKSNLIIIDRLGKINKIFSKKLDKFFLKKIILDDSSKNRKFFDLSLNPLITNVKKFSFSNIGIKYFISPIFFFKPNKKIKIKKGVFLFFGGHDKNNLTNKILQFLSKYNDLIYYIPVSLKKNIKKSLLKKNMIFFKSKYFYKYMHISKISIISGGMSLYDSIILKKNVICIPQYSHQTKNIKVNNLNKYLNYLYIRDTSFKNKFLKIFNLLYYKKNIVNNYKLSLSKRHIKNTLKKIERVYGETIN